MINYFINKIRNGNRLVKLVTYKCNQCGCDVNECWPHYIDSTQVFCNDCAFKNGSISEAEYLKTCGIYLPNLRAVISPITDEIELTTQKRFQWERVDKQQRHSPEYVKWRMDVFERDHYTCQICKKVGGVLNAHHIKPFAKYKRLRLVVSNGITLCESCHKQLHRKKTGD